MIRRRAPWLHAISDDQGIDVDAIRNVVEINELASLEGIIVIGVVWLAANPSTMCSDIIAGR